MNILCCEGLTLSNPSFCRRLPQAEAVPFCTAGAWAKGVRVEKDGPGLWQVWKREIQQFKRVSPAMAAAIEEVYPSPGLLLQDQLKVSLRIWFPIPTGAAEGLLYASHCPYPTWYVQQLLLSLTVWEVCLQVGGLDSSEFYPLNLVCLDESSAMDPPCNNGIEHWR
nr:PREDICTED: probable crossover junction endonuclease EME2 isoform X1 [Struthio camelus australis]